MSDREILLSIAGGFLLIGILIVWRLLWRAHQWEKDHTYETPGHTYRPARPGEMEKAEAWAKDKDKFQKMDKSESDQNLESQN